MTIQDKINILEACGLAENVCTCIHDFWGKRISKKRAIYLALFGRYGIL